MFRLSKILCLAVILALISAIGARADSPAPAATPPQATLIELLKSNASLEQKSIACHQLAWIGNREAVPVLAGLLGDEKLSHMARYALEQIPDPSVAEALRAAAPKLKGKLLAGVLSSLGARRDEKSIPMLSERMKDTDAEVANAAAFALGKIGTPAAADAIETAMVGPGNAAKMKKFGLLSGPLRNLRPALCEAAIRCADKLIAEGHRDKAVNLFDILVVSDAPIQLRVAATRGAILNGPRSQDLLAELLESKDRAMFNLALQLAHELPGAEASKTYVAHLGELGPANQARLIQALGQRRDKAALPAIRAAAKQSDPAVRTAAIRSLALLGDTESLSVILEAATAPEKDVSAAAIVAVVKMPGSEIDAALGKMVESPDVSKWLVAIDCLARRHTASATQALLKIAGEGESQARQAAIKALSQVAGEADLPQAIVVLQKAGTPAERTAPENVVIAICLSASDKEACAGKVVAAMAQANADQKAAIFHVLIAVGGAKGLQAVRDTIKNSPKDVQESAIAALCVWPDQAAAPDLLALAHDPSQPNYKIRALRGYLRLALDVDLPAEKRVEMSAAAQPLIERDEERRLLIRVLSRIQSRKALAMIEPFLENPSVKTDAAAAAVAVAGKLAQTPDAKASADEIISAMDKVKQAGPNADLARKAGDIQARVRHLLRLKTGIEPLQRLRHANTSATA